MSATREQLTCRFVLTPDSSAGETLPSAASESTAADAPLAALHALPDLSRLLQCSHCVRRRRRDKSGARDRRYGMVCDVPQACSMRRGMLRPPCPLSPSTTRAGSEHEHGGSCGLIHRVRMVCVRLEIAKRMRGSLDNGGRAATSRYETGVGGAWTGGLLPGSF